MKTATAAGALALALVLSSPAEARVDLFCGLATGSICPGMLIMAAKHDGHVHAHTSASSVSQQIAVSKPAVVKLGGHSAGCSAAVTAAWHLQKRKVPVALLLCFDGATAFMETKTVPSNVKVAVSWRQDGFLGGARLCKRGHQLKEYVLTYGGKRLVFDNVCVERRGGTVIIESTVPLDHFTIGGGNPWINAQADVLLGK